MSPFLLALGNREELVRNGKLTSIIFVRDVNSKGQEVSGYIDYAHRLRSNNFEPYFERRKKVCVCVCARARVVLLFRRESRTVRSDQ